MKRRKEQPTRGCEWNSSRILEKTVAMSKSTDVRVRAATLYFLPVQTRMPLNLAPAHYPKGAPADPDWNKRPGWMVIAAQLQGLDAQPLSHALLRALWAEERDTSAAEVRIAVADENGYDGAALQALEQGAETLAIYRANSAEAVEQGVFGAPTYVLDGERFWGQDRLDFLNRALDRLRGR